MVKVFINDIEIEETPVGWLDFTTTLRMDRELKALFEIMEVPLTFYFDGYRLISAAYGAFGYCFSYPVRIHQEDENGQYIVIFNGTLFFKDIEFTEGVEGFSAKCQLTDNSFFAKIYNNRNLKAKIYVPRSKSDLTIPAADYWRITFFKPSDGTYYTHLSGAGYERNDTGFRVYDVLKFLVAFMSDGEVDFISDYFNTGGEGEGAMITCGLIPRFTSGTIGAGVTQELFEENFPDLSFADVFKEMNIEENLGIRAGFNGSRPYIRIENNKYLFPNTELLNMADLEKLKRKTAVEYLPAKVVIGSEIITDEVFLSAPATIRFQGANKEEYIIVQDCNTDQEANLVNSWIVDSNTIEDVLVNALTVPTTNDSEIILINTTLDYMNIWGDAVQSNWLATPPPYYYNERYINANKAKRHLGSIPANIAAYLGNTDDTFSARNDSSSITYFVGSHSYNPQPFEVEISDPSNNYDPVTSEYKAPNTGVYTFYSLFNFILDGNISNGGVIDLSTLQIVIDRYDSSGFVGGNLLTSTIIVSIRFSGTGVIVASIDGSGNILMNQDDKAVIRFVFSTPNDTAILRRPLGLFQCIATNNGGGVYQTYDPTDFPVIRNQFDYPISFREFRELRNQPLGLLSFNVKGSRTYSAWIEEIKYKHFQASSSFTLISNEKNN